MSAATLWRADADQIAAAVWLIEQRRARWRRRRVVVCGERGVERDYKAKSADDAWQGQFVPDKDARGGDDEKISFSFSGGDSDGDDEDKKHDEEGL